MAITIKDIAREFGVAPSTVSNALNGRYKGAYRKTAARSEEIRAYAEEHGYRPNGAARAIRAQRTYQIGALLPNQPERPFNHPNDFETLLGINAGLQTTGYVVSIIRLADLTQEVISHTKLFSEKTLEGLVVLGGHSEEMVAEFEKLVPNIVWADTNVWRDTGCIRRDETAAGHEAVEQVAACGYRRIIWLGYPDNPKSLHYSHIDRSAGAFAAAKEAGLQSYRHVIDLDDTGADQWNSLLPELAPDTALVVESVYHAQALSHVLAALGRTAPRDFGLVCCDGSQDMNRLWPDLSRVAFERFDMGRQAGEMLRSMIEDDDDSVQNKSRILRGSWIQGKTIQSCK
jgi:LacI family transcriptional regulator